MTRKQALAGILCRWPGLSDEAINLRISAKILGPRRLLVQIVELWVYSPDDLGGRDLGDMPSQFGMGKNITDAFAALLKRDKAITELEAGWIRRKEKEDAEN